MHTQITGAFDGGEVARVFVLVNAGQKVLKQGLCARLARGDFQGLQVGGLKAHVGQAGNRVGQIVGAGGQAIRQGGHLESLQVFGGDFFQPSVFVGREHAEGLGHLGQHLVALKHHMVFEGVQHDAMVGQVATHLDVAGQRQGLVVVVGKYHLRLQVLSQLDDFVLGHAVSHDQARLRVAREFAQAGIHLDQRFADELNPAVGAGQVVQDLGVEHKRHVHALAVLQGLVQGRVVTHTQIAPQPDQATRKRGFHRGMPVGVKHCTLDPVHRNGAAKIGA